MFVYPRSESILDRHDSVVVRYSHPDSNGILLLRKGRCPHIYRGDIGLLYSLFYRGYYIGVGLIEGRGWEGRNNSSDFVQVISFSFDLLQETGEGLVHH